MSSFQVGDNLLRLFTDLSQVNKIKRGNVYTIVAKDRGRLIVLDDVGDEHHISPDFYSNWKLLNTLVNGKAVISLVHQRAWVGAQLTRTDPSGTTRIRHGHSYQVVEVHYDNRGTDRVVVLDENLDTFAIQERFFDRWALPMFANNLEAISLLKED